MKGTIEQIIGPVIDVYFENELPDIKNALILEHKDKKITFEVMAHTGLGRVKAIAMKDTAGLQAGMEVEDTGAPISVPVGEKVLGRLFNVLGETVDGGEDVITKNK